MVIIAHVSNYLVFIFAPVGSLGYLGYFTSFLASLLGILILIVEFPFHSFIQGAVFVSFLAIRGGWSLILGTYIIIWDILTSDVLNMREISSFLHKFEDFLGWVVVLGGLFLSFLIGALVFACFSLFYLRIALKFHKMLKKRKTFSEKYEMQTKNDGEDVEKGSNDGSGKNLVVVGKKNNQMSNFCLGGIACCFRFCGLHNFGNLEFQIGSQLSSTMRMMHGIALDDIIHEKILDETKKDSTSLEFSLILLLLTRKKMEKLKLCKPQPILGEALAAMMKRLEGRATGIFPKMKYLAIQSLFIIFNLNSLLSILEN